MPVETALSPTLNAARASDNDVELGVRMALQWTVHRGLFAGAVLLLLLPAPSVAAELADLSLEQLSEVVVSSVSRREERLDRSAASVYVISGEDIRRSGATTLAEALRLAPQLHVARADANQYAISARGFNNVLANKMLVLIDGRTLYTPLFSGVFWQDQDTMLEDIDRIEVVSGPSAALWGTNAVNGLIHIITRKASRTQGAAAFMHLGNHQHVVSVRFGDTIGERTHYRVYAKAYHRNDTEKITGESVNDASSGVQAGWRADWEEGLSSLTLQGDVYRVETGDQGAVRRTEGANLLGRWRQAVGSGARLTLRGYVEHTDLRTPAFKENLDTLDLLAQYDFPTSPRNRVVIGAGHRVARDDTSNGPTLGFLPAKRTMRWSRLFAQDQFDVDEHLSLGLAASVEHNPYTGTEVLPSARLSWTPVLGRTAWAAASRAVRAPSRIDRDFFLPAQPPFQLAGGPQFESEVARVLEIGYRAQPSVALSYSVTLFHHDFRRLRSIFVTPTGLQFGNDLRGTTQGVEASMSWRVNERWRLVAGGTTLKKRIELEPGGSDLGGEASLGNDPSYWWSLRSTVDLTPRWIWDVTMRRSGRLPSPHVPAYTEVDMRLAWSVTPEHELALVLRNLSDAHHAEWGPASNRVEFGRGVALQFRWRL
jgi:iron complex outermembrane receptor protein